MQRSSSVVARFCLVLTVLPATVTYLFLRRQIQNANICFVEDVTGGQEDVTGIYRQRAQGFSYLRREAPFANSWSSIAEMGRVLAPPVRSKDIFVTLLAAIVDMTGDDKGPELTNRGGRWCIEPLKICSPHKAVRRRPSEGIYSNGTFALKVSCHDIESLFVDDETKAKKPGLPVDVKLPKEIEAFEPDGYNFVMYRPASALLLAMMLFLAYRTSIHNGATEQVAFSYDSIVERWEFWRAFTGSTAHTKPFHLAFNMYSLYSLGSELEESFGSILFLLYNIAFIPLTVMLTLLFIKTMGDDRKRRQMIVGYSGVLFAWSTVAASRLPISWPFHFGKITAKLFFKTIKVGPLKFNPSPFIRMGIIHLVVPNASWEAHLAGIVCGLAMQCGCLPLSLAQPAILIPSILWLHYYAVREAIAFDAVEQVILDYKNRNSPAMKEHQRVRRVCELLRNLLVPVGLLGCMFFDWSMSLQLALVLLFLNACIINHIEDVPMVATKGNGWNEAHRRKRRSEMLWKAFLLTCFLSVLADSMAFGGWMSCNSFWFSNRYTRLQFSFACILMIVRVALQTAGFAVAAKRFLDLRPNTVEVFFQIFAPYHLSDGATTAMALTQALDPLLAHDHTSWLLTAGFVSWLDEPATVASRIHRLVKTLGHSLDDDVAKEDWPPVEDIMEDLSPVEGDHTEESEVEQVDY